MTQREIMESFAEVYWAAMPHFNRLSSVKANTKIAKRFKSEFNQSLKWLLKHCGTLVPPKASKSALNFANLYGIDLFALQWRDQRSAEKIISGVKGRKKFIHEHEIPVSAMYEKIKKAESKEDIIHILMNQSIVWITREEEKRLHPYIRNHDAYLSADIHILENSYGDNWMEKSWRRQKNAE